MFNTTAYGKVVVKYIQAVKYVLMLLRSGFGDMWKLFLCQFQRFEFPIWEMLHVFAIHICLPVSGSPSPLRLCQLPAALRLPQKNHPFGVLKYASSGFRHFLRFQGPPSPLRLCRSCLRRFGSLKQNTLLDCWSMYCVNVVDFVDFRVPDGSAVVR